MNFRNISAWSIRNPVVPIVLFVGLTLAGIISFMRMEVQNDPDIEFPIVIATIQQPGAAPSEIETQITQKVESAIRGIDGVRRGDWRIVQDGTLIELPADSSAVVVGSVAN